MTTEGPTERPVDLSTEFSWRAVAGESGPGTAGKASATYTLDVHNRAPVVVGGCVPTSGLQDLGVAPILPFFVTADAFAAGRHRVLDLRDQSPGPAVHPGGAPRAVASHYFGRVVTGSDSPAGSPDVVFQTGETVLVESEPGTYRTGLAEQDRFDLDGGAVLEPGGLALDK